MNGLHLLGVAELADRLHVSTSLVAMWAKRGKLPPPDAELRCGAIWLTETIERWEREKG